MMWCLPSYFHHVGTELILAATGKTHFHCLLFNPIFVIKHLIDIFSHQLLVTILLRGGGHGQVVHEVE